MGKTKLVDDFFWISYILFFGMYLTKYQNSCDSLLTILNGLSIVVISII
jgi:hypothetical protein